MGLKCWNLIWWCNADFSHQYFTKIQNNVSGKLANYVQQKQRSKFVKDSNGMLISNKNYVTIPEYLKMVNSKPQL